jgi:hypothetical protein
MPGNDHGAEMDRLARVAKDANIVVAVHALRGEFIAFFERETRAYHEAPDLHGQTKAWLHGSMRVTRRCRFAGRGMSPS